MTYHEIKIRNKKRYNYIVHTIRDGRKWKKARKYIGEGNLSEEKVKNELKNFDRFLVKTNYLTEEQKEFIEVIRLRFFNYLKKGGKAVSDRFRLKDKGIKYIDHHEYGDEYVQVNLATPNKLSKKQQELFKQLEKEEENFQKSLFQKIKDSLK